MSATTRTAPGLAASLRKLDRADAAAERASGRVDDATMDRLTADAYEALEDLEDAIRTDGGPEALGAVIGDRLILVRAAYVDGVDEAANFARISVRRIVGFPSV